LTALSIRRSALAVTPRMAHTALAGGRRSVPEWFLRQW